MSPQQVVHSLETRLEAAQRAGRQDEARRIEKLLNEARDYLDYWNLLIYST